MRRLFQTKAIGVVLKGGKRFLRRTKSAQEPGAAQEVPCKQAGAFFFT